jgi:hypothetical protein
VFLKPKVIDKIKEKFTLNHIGILLLKFFCMMLFFVFLGSFTLTKTANAAVVNDTDLKLTIGIVPDNFFRTFATSTFQLTSSVQLTSPTRLNFATYPFTTAEANSFDYLSKNVASNMMSGVGVGLIGENAKTKDCGKSIISAATSVYSCNFAKDYTAKSGGLWQSTSSPLQNGMTISPADLKKLEITKSAPEGAVSSFYACPYIILGNHGDPPATFLSGCKQIFIQVYDTQANYAAHLSDPRPDTVPGNGSVTSSPSTGSGLVGLINDIITAIASFIISILYQIFAKIVIPTIVAILSVRTYADTFVNVIYVGWQILRNVSNIVFIIALIVIGLATLFRTSGYEYKHLLVELILAALLVNFSLVIGQSVLALAETAQHQFLPDNKKIVNTLAGKLMPTEIKQKVESSGILSSTVFGTAGTTVFLMAMAIGAFGVFAAIAVFLVIRVVALWLLLMVSPLAFAAKVLPSTHHFEQEWWNNFIKYAFFAPIMAFFLNIAAVIADNYPTVLKTVMTTSFTSEPGIVNTFLQVASNIILLVFLYAALKVSEDFGIFGAHTITDLAQQGMFAPFKIAGGIAAAPLVGAKNLAEAAGGLIMQKKTQYSTPLAKKGFLGKAAFVALNPGSFKKAWVERRDDRKHKIQALAEGEGSNIVHSLPFMKEATPDDREHAFLHGIDDEAKKLPYVSERATFSLVQEMMDNGKGNKDVIARMKLWGQIKNLAEEKGMNFTLLNAKKLGMSKNFSASYDGFLEFMNEMEEKGFATEGEIGHIAPDLGKISYKNREYWYSEAQRAHGAHTILIKTTKDADGNVVIAGKDVFDRVNEVIEHEVEEKVEAERSAILASGGTFSDQDEQNTRLKARAEISEHEKHSLSAADHDLYENYDAYEQGKSEIYTNYTKMAPQQKARDAHWSTEVEVYEDEHGVSKNKMSMLGVAHMATADGGDFSQGNQLQLKKRRAFQAAFTQNKEFNKTELLKYIRNQRLQEYKEKGVKITQEVTDKIERESQALRDFRYAIFEKFYVDGDKFEKGTKEKMKKQFLDSEDPEIKAAYARLASVPDLEDELLRHI